MSSVSVIIPTYNRRGLVESAVASVLVQTLRPLEVIVVDDGSTDGTAEVQTFGERIRYLRQEHSGRSAARNRGLEAAQGDFIAFLDSDDVWHPDKLARQVPALAAQPEAGLIHGVTEVIDGDRRRLEAESRRRLAEHQEALRRGYSYVEMARKCVMFTSTVVARRSALKMVGGFDPHLESYEDWDLYLRLALSWRIMDPPDLAPVTRYRLHGSRTSNASFSRDRVSVGRKHLAILQGLRGEPWVHRAARYLELQIAEGYYQGGDYRRCRRALLGVIRRHPAELLSSRNLKRLAITSMVRSQAS